MITTHHWIVNSSYAPVPFVDKNENKKNQKSVRVQSTNRQF